MCVYVYIYIYIHIANINWKIKVYDAVIVAKLMYGLASIPLTTTDGITKWRFEMKGLITILKDQHPYWSRVSNKSCLRELTLNLRENLRTKNSEGSQQKLSKDKYYYTHTT